MVFNLKKVSILLFVLVLLFLIEPFLVESFFWSKYTEAKINFSKVKIVLHEYYNQCGKYPTTEEGLKLLIKASSCYKNAVIKEDALKNGHGIEFVYVSDGKQFRLISLNKEGYLETDTSK